MAVEDFANAFLKVERKKQLPQQEKVNSSRESDLPGSNRRPQDDQLTITVSRSSN